MPAYQQPSPRTDSTRQAHYSFTELADAASFVASHASDADAEEFGFYANNLQVLAACQQLAKAGVAFPQFQSKKTVDGSEYKVMQDWYNACKSILQNTSSALHNSTTRALAQVLTIEQQRQQELAAIDSARAARNMAGARLAASSLPGGSSRTVARTVAKTNFTALEDCL